MSENPYQTPAVREVARPALASRNAKLIREAHLHTEASLKGMGSLFFLGGLLALFVVINMASEPLGEGLSQGPTFLMLLVYIGIIPLQFVSWWGLRKLRPWARIPAGLLSGLGMMAIGLGTVLSIYFLYLLFGKKGRMVLSPAYHEIMEQTPDMKYRTPMWNWIVLAVILILIGGAVVYFSNFSE